MSSFSSHRIFLEGKYNDWKFFKGNNIIQILINMFLFLLCAMRFTCIYYTVLITIFNKTNAVKFQIPPFVNIQANFKILNYMRRDMIDSIEGVTSPDITLAMDLKILVSIKMFTTDLPLSVLAFNELVRKCANVSTVFNLFTLLNSDTITCRFSFLNNIKMYRSFLFNPVSLPISPKHKRSCINSPSSIQFLSAICLFQFLQRRQNLCIIQHTMN